MGRIKVIRVAAHDVRERSITLSIDYDDDVTHATVQYWPASPFPTTKGALRTTLATIGGELQSAQATVLIEGLPD
jgi:hypothetical protein